MSELGLKKILISEIRENTVALRDVNRESEGYQGLVDSIRSKGFMGAITVRPKTDDETGEEFYELVDGLHRFSASKDAGLEEINVDVVSLDEDQVLEAQIMANIHRIETKPVEYTQQLRRILTRNPLMTESELAEKLGKSAAWIKQRLSLHKIDNEEIQGLIDEGKISLSNAYALAKLPPAEQADFVDDAMNLAPDEFVPKCAERAKEIRDAKRKGDEAGPREFVPTPHLRKLTDIKAELENGEACASLNPADAESFNLAIQWILHLDPQSVEVARAKDEERMQIREEKKAKRTAERELAKQEKLRKQLEEGAEAVEAAKAVLASDEA